MENEIIKSIQILKKKGVVSSMEYIYDFIRSKHHNISIETFKTSFDKLTEEGSLLHEENSQSYYLNFDADINFGIDNDTGSFSNEYANTYSNGGDWWNVDRTLIHMIKDSMQNDKERNREYVDFLKSEVEFLKSELNNKNLEIKQKNELISHLLNNSVVNKQHDDTITPPGMIYTLNNNTTKRTSAPSDKPDTNTNGHLNRDIQPESKQTIPIIEIIGDSHLNPIDANGISNKKNIIVRNHPGSTTEDIKSHIIPSLQKKRDAFIIHSGANALTNNVDTIENMQSIVNSIKRKSSHSKIAISSVFIRTDKKDMPNKVKNLNIKLKAFCEENLIDFICNDNVDELCLGLKKLHLNKKGNGRFATNIINYTKQLY